MALICMSRVEEYLMKRKGLITNSLSNTAFIKDSHLESYLSSIVQRSSSWGWSLFGLMLQRFKKELLRDLNYQSPEVCKAL